MLNLDKFQKSFIKQLKNEYFLNGGKRSKGAPAYTLSDMLEVRSLLERVSLRESQSVANGMSSIYFLYICWL